MDSWKFQHNFATPLEWKESPENRILTWWEDRDWKRWLQNGVGGQVIRNIRWRWGCEARSPARKWQSICGALYARDRTLISARDRFSLSTARPYAIPYGDANLHTPYCEETIGGSFVARMCQRVCVSMLLYFGAWEASVFPNIQSFSLWHGSAPLEWGGFPLLACSIPTAW